MMMTSIHLLCKTLLFGHFLALLFLHIVTFFLGNLRVLISVITLISLIMLTLVMAVLVFGGRKKPLKERTSETHFYALLSMVAGAVIGWRPEKNTSSKRRHKYVLCRNSTFYIFRESIFWQWQKCVLTYKSLLYIVITLALDSFEGMYPWEHILYQYISLHIIIIVIICLKVCTPESKEECTTTYTEECQVSINLFSLFSVCLFWNPCEIWHILFIQRRFWQSHKPIRYHNVSKSSSHHFVSIKASARGVIVNRPLRPLTSVLRHLFPDLCIFICNWWPLIFPKPFLAFLYTCPRNPPRTFDKELFHTLEPEGAIYIKLYLQKSSKERKVL